MMAYTLSASLEKTDSTAQLIMLSMLAFIGLLPLVLTQYFSPMHFMLSPHTHVSGRAANLIGDLFLTPVVPPLIEPEAFSMKQLAPPTALPTLAAHTVAPAPAVVPPSPVAPTPIALKGTQTITTQRGDTLGKIFNRLHISQNTLQQLMKNPPQSRLLTRLKPGQTITLTFQQNELQQLVFPYATTESLEVSRDHQQYRGVIRRTPTTVQHQYVSTALHGSIYNTAKKAHIPSTLIAQMIRIFHRDIDFKKGLRANDRFSILYQANYIQKKQVSTGKILAVTYTTRGKTHEAVRYTDRRGTTNYYTPTGYNLEKAYDRYPVKFSHIASPFSLSRYHPVLHYRRPHYGIDLAAPMGTPIHAIGDGQIEFIGRQSGYGNMVKIHHNSMYVSIYGHLSHFQKGLYHGATVKRGQIIGYVGQSGLASGPHCHFEFHIHHHPTNPTTIALPHADPIPKREIQTFKHQTNQLLAELQSHRDAVKR